MSTNGPEMTLPILLDKWLTNSITPAEKQELYAMIKDPANDLLIQQIIDKDLSGGLLDGPEDLELRESLFKKIQQAKNKADAPVISLRRRRIWKIAVAAVVAGLILGTLYFTGVFDRKKQNEIVQTQPDLNPGSYKARLTLADGRVIILDSAGLGELAKQGTTVIINKDGQLVYTTTGKSDEVLYNTLSTAKGEAYSTVLADGSKVWLNSASSIRYPVSFVGNERKVEITGEAYFEVARNTAQPFKVDIAGRGEVEVLGTHFNISSYDNEDGIKTTLLEGSVRVNNSVVLKPGQQAIAGNTITVNNNVDIEKIVAWKDNVFMFSGDDIQSVMRQIARWYDVDVEFKGQITDRHFTGIISRNNKVSEVLKMLQGTEKIKFEVTGKKIIVSK